MWASFIDNKFEELENSWEDISILEEFVYSFSRLFKIPQTKSPDMNSDANFNYKKANKLKCLYQMMFYILHDGK